MLGLAKELKILQTCLLLIIELHQAIDLTHGAECKDASECACYRLAEQFTKPNFFEPLVAGEDTLPNRHANTHLAQV